MSIYAPTPLLISTGPLSATHCQPCSMMAISRWWAGSPGKVATAPQPSPVCQSAPCLSQFPHTPLLPECVFFFFFFFLGRWKQGQKEQCLQCLFLTSAVNVGSIRACVFNSKKMPRAFFFFFFSFVNKPCCEHDIHYPPVFTQSWKMLRHHETSWPIEKVVLSWTSCVSLKTTLLHANWLVIHS